MLAICCFLVLYLILSLGSLFIIIMVEEDLPDFGTFAMWMSLWWAFYIVLGIVFIIYGIYITIHSYPDIKETWWKNFKEELP